ncbi:hypothetical protein ACP70R_006390 [Stipagrostis hirtigluma subsp. patula]
MATAYAARLRRRALGTGLASRRGEGMDRDQRAVDHVPKNPKLLTIANTQEKFEVPLRGDGAVPPVAAAFMAAISAGEQAVMVAQDVAGPSTVPIAGAQGSAEPLPPSELAHKPSIAGYIKTQFLYS